MIFMPTLLSKERNINQFMWHSPSKKNMRGIYSRHSSLKRRSAEYVDCGCINMANKDTITDYFILSLEAWVKCDIVKLDSHGEVIQEAMKQKRVDLSDKTGWSVQSKCIWMRWSKACLLEKSKWWKPLDFYVRYLWELWSDIGKIIPTCWEGWVKLFLRKCYFARPTKGLWKKMFFLSVAWKQCNSTGFSRGMYINKL